MVTKSTVCVFTLYYINAIIAAAACGASLALGANAAWDIADSEISGEKRGIIKAVDDIASGNADVGDVSFQNVHGQTLMATFGASIVKSR